MIKILVLISIFLVNLSGISVSSNDNYKVFKSDNYSIVFTHTYKNEALFIKENIDSFLEHNNKSFGYSFDEPIKIVLISDNIQMPNAFSTPIPYNMGIYYNGGSSMNDYFSSKSWLVTLFTHEMIHNYQMNAKKSEISKTLHKFLGNNYMPIMAVVPLFTLPNLLLPTGLVEGSAVLNETLYGNGGRLYSGRLNALKNSLIFHNKVTPTSFINDHLDFPYMAEKYIVGGYYMQYMANKYGLDKVNSFFYEHSIHSINPFLLNSTFKDLFFITFEDSINDFVAYTKEIYKEYKELPTSNILASSKDEIYLSKIENKIYFTTSDLKSNKYLNIYDKAKNLNYQEYSGLKNGKIFKIDDKLYVASHDFISSREYKHGLFDENNYILETTKGKSINDIYKDKIAYVNIKESFLNTSLYIDDTYYCDVASSALFDDSGDIYYFKQMDKQRVLYKNKKELYRFDGYYSKLVEIVDNDIYFISNSLYGSTLYRYNNDKLYRLSDSDNIINGKIIDKNNALVVTVTANQYNVKKISIKDEVLVTIENSKLIDIKNNYKLNFNTKDIELKTQNYNELKQLEFSALYLNHTRDSVDGDIYTANGLFMDPIMFNMINIYLYKDIDTKVGGINYINERYIPFKVDLRDVDRTDILTNKRSYGASFEIYGPLVKKGNNLLEINLQKYFDDDNKDKQPTVLALDYRYKKSFALEISPYLQNDMQLIIKEDRSDIAYGIDLKINKHIADELYINGQIKGMFSDTKILQNEKGIEIVTDTIDMDNTNIFIESIDNNIFVKDITKLSIGLTKSLNFNSYFYNFPISLRNEALFYKYNNYHITEDSKYNLQEHILGLKLDLLLVHKMSLPLDIKIVKNIDAVNKYKVVITAGIEF